MNAFALHAPGDHAARRWAGAALAVIALHAGVIAGAIALYRQHAPPGSSEPAIMIDLAPISAAPEATPLDVAPGPEMKQAEAPSAPPPEPQAQQPVEQPIPPTPLMEKAEVAAPPKQEVAPTPPPPEPAKLAPEKPKPVERPKPVHAEVKKKPNESKPAPRTSAPVHAEHTAPATSAAAAGASRAATADYSQMVQAHVQRFKQYPSGDRSGQAGRVRTMVAFTLSRSGSVLSVRSMGGSGNPAFDAESVATVRRAQPFPPFPAEMKVATQSFTLPLSYDLR